MKKVTLVLMVISSVFAITLKAQTSTDNLTDAEKAYILSRYCTEVKYNFVFYNDIAFDWDSLCMATLPALLETKTIGEYAQGLKHLASKLQDGHTGIFANNVGESSGWVKPFPFKTKRVGDRVFVTEVQSSEFKEKGVERGAEVLRINDMDVIDYVNKNIRPYVSSSTPQWLDYYPYAGFELTKDNGNKTSAILFRGLNGKTFTIESSRNIEWDLKSDSPIFDYKVLEGNTGYLKVNTFMGDNFVEEFNKIYPEIQNTNALIIDLRDNTGGNSGYADYIIRHLSDQPVKMGRWSSRMYIAAHGSWNYPQEWFMVTPDDLTPIKNKTLYTNPMVLLVNSTTFSSAENFCVTFRGLNKGKIIGTPTGGSTGNPIFIHLGKGIYAQICTKNEWDVAGNKFIGVGIIPDILVEETPDLFLTGKDVVLEEAFRELKRMVR